MFNANLRSITKSAVQAMITHDMDEWPPSCFGLLYQPIRPNRKRENIFLEAKMDAHEINSSRT